MLFNFFLTFFLVFSNLNAGSMESVFKRQKPTPDVEAVSDTGVASETEKTAEIEKTTVTETDVPAETSKAQVEQAKETVHERNAANVFKPVKIERQSSSDNATRNDSGSRAASVFGHRSVSNSGDVQTKESRASSVFLGHSAEKGEDDKQVVEVSEENLEGNYSGKDFLWPVEKGQVSSYYGWRSSKKFHDGIDISAPTGTKIFAVKEGKVVYSGKKIRGYGNMIVIKHVGKTYSVYAHNSVNKVSTGDAVSKGDVIGLVGNTGRSHGPHVHFEVRQGKYSVDPLKYFNYMENRKGGRKHGFEHEFK